MQVLVVDIKNRALRYLRNIMARCRWEAPSEVTGRSRLTGRRGWPPHGLSGLVCWLGGAWYWCAVVWASWPIAWLTLRSGLSLRSWLALVGAWLTLRSARVATGVAALSGLSLLDRLAWLNRLAWCTGKTLRWCVKVWSACSCLTVTGRGSLWRSLRSTRCTLRSLRSTLRSLRTALAWRLNATGTGWLGCAVRKAEARRAGLWRRTIGPAI